MPAPKKRSISKIGNDHASHVRMNAKSQKRTGAASAAADMDVEGSGVRLEHDPTLMRVDMLALMTRPRSWRVSVYPTTSVLPLIVMTTERSVRTTSYMTRRCQRDD